MLSLPHPQESWPAVRTVTIPRSTVTVEEVRGVLESDLGSRYSVTPFAKSRFHHESAGDENSILVRRNWFMQASVRVENGINNTEIHVGSAANFTPTGLLLNNATVMRKVQHVLEDSQDLAGSSPVS
jgi:hypothetical protein